MYSLCGNKASSYYLKTRDNRVRLISCLPDSNRNSAGEFVRVRGNWFAGDVPCPLSRREVGSYQSLDLTVFPPFSFYSFSFLFIEVDLYHRILIQHLFFCRWQSVRSGHQNRPRERPELHPSFRDIRARGRTAPGLPPDSRSRASLLYLTAL